MTNGVNHVGRIGALDGQPIEHDPGDQDPWTFTANQNDYLSISIGEKLTSEIDRSGPTSGSSARPAQSWARTPARSPPGSHCARR